MFLAKYSRCYLMALCVDLFKSGFSQCSIWWLMDSVEAGISRNPWVEVGRWRASVHN